MPPAPSEDAWGRARMQNVGSPPGTPENVISQEEPKPGMAGRTRSHRPSAYVLNSLSRDEPSPTHDAYSSADPPYLLWEPHMKLWRSMPSGTLLVRKAAFKRLVIPEGLSMSAAEEELRLLEAVVVERALPRFFHQTLSSPLRGAYQRGELRELQDLENRGVFGNPVAKGEDTIAIRPVVGICGQAHYPWPGNV